MDTSGDGKIDNGELRQGFEKIVDPVDRIDDRTAQNIIDKLDMNQALDENMPSMSGEAAQMEFSEFLYGCVDTRPDAFLEYCRAAYTKFFDNGQETIDVNELTGILCQERLISAQSIEIMIEEMDVTNNGSIQYFEFYEVLI